MFDGVKKVDSIDIDINPKDKFSYKLEQEAKEKISNTYKDINQFFKRYINPDGTENIQKFVKDMAILENFENIVRSASSYSKGAGREDVIKDIKNPDFQGSNKQDQGSGKLSIAAQAAKEIFKR